MDEGQAGADEAQAGMDDHPTGPGTGSRRGLRAGLAVVVLLVAVIGFLWFRPDKLFVDEAVDEALPAAAATAGDAGDPQEPGEEDPPSGTAGSTEDAAAVVAEGSFISHDHPTSGTARVVDLPDGTRILRLEDFRTDNGPDLRVYLSTADAAVNSRELAADFVDLGTLKGNVGNQNYEVDPSVDLARYKTVVIWCVRFAVSFGAAELS